MQLVIARVLTAYVALVLGLSATATLAAAQAPSANRTGAGPARALDIF